MPNILRNLSSSEIDWREVVFDLTYRRNKSRVAIASELRMSTESLTQIGNGIRGKQITYDTGNKLCDAWGVLMIPKLRPNRKLVQTQKDIDKRNTAIFGFLDAVERAIDISSADDEGDGYVLEQISDFLKYYSASELLEFASNIQIKRPPPKTLSEARSEVQIVLPFI